MKNQFKLQKKDQIDKQWFIFNLLLCITCLIIARLSFCTINGSFNTIEWIALTSFLVLAAIYVISTVVKDRIQKK